MEEVAWADVRSLSKVAGSDRDNGFDLSLEFVTAAQKPAKRAYALLGSALPHQGADAVALLQGFIPTTDTSTASATVPPTLELPA